MKIIVGLGNPGTQYRMSRHNIGFQVVDRVAQISHISIRTKRFRSLYGTGWIDFQQVDPVQANDVHESKWRSG